MKKITKEIITLLPQNTISKCVGKLVKSSISKHLILPFANHYGINIDDAEKHLSKYTSLNEFFTRKLKEGKRPVEKEATAIVSPVDGVVAQVGRIENGTLIQAKGINYELDRLIQHENKEKFKNGHFMTVYLSPKDYHRIHSPFDAKITGHEYIPGRLFPVNNIGVNYVESLFTKNERLTTFFDVNGGTAALVKVGAFIVGSVQLSYEENIHQKHRGLYYKKSITDKLSIGKGEELAWFEFGSTIILILEEKIGEFDKEILPGTSLQMGKRIGILTEYIK